MGGKGEDDDRRSERCYYVQKNYASLAVPCPTPSPSLPTMTFSLSLCLPPPVLLLPTSSLYLSILSFSFTPSIFTSTLSFFLPYALSLLVVLFFILSLSVCHLYCGGTWRPRAPVKYHCRYVCVCVCTLMHTCLLACSCSGNMLSLNQICISNLSAGLLHWPGALLYLHIEL